jgi:hypothetical protein
VGTPGRILDIKNRYDHDDSHCHYYSAQIFVDVLCQVCVACIVFCVVVFLCCVFRVIINCIVLCYDICSPYLRSRTERHESYDDSCMNGVCL